MVPYHGSGRSYSVHFNKHHGILAVTVQKSVPKNTEPKGFRQCNSKALVSFCVWVFPGLANDSGSSESSLGMMIKVKLGLTFMQNVICTPPAMSSLLIFFFLSFHFYPSTKHSVKFEEKGFLSKTD